MAVKRPLRTLGRCLIFWFSAKIPTARSPRRKPGPRFFCFMPFFVYILESQRNGTLYLGYTDDIFRRVAAHKAHSLGGLTAKYNDERLVWYETHESRESAWTREHQMKKWRRAWKLELIERFNPSWRDLFEDFV